MVHFTKAGTAYLTSPRASLVAFTQMTTSPLYGFLRGFDEELGFMEYLENEDTLTDPDELCKVAGQLCYMSFGPGHTPHTEAARYFANIKDQGHGSVLEHASFTFLLWGIDRSVTHELVRHRAGFGFSQVSQRYVDGKVLRFVERPEFQSRPLLHTLFEDRIDRASAEYDQLAADLQVVMREEVEGLPKRDARKRVNQAARALLPNETEAPTVVTGNARAWRNFLDQRGSVHADIPISMLAITLWRELIRVAPAIFNDYELEATDKGRLHLTTPYRKV